MSAKMKVHILKTTKEKEEEKTADFKKQKGKEKTPCRSVLFSVFCCRHSLPPAVCSRLRGFFVVPSAVIAVRSVCQPPSLPRAAVGQSPCRRPVVGFSAVPLAPPGRCPCPPRSRGLSAVFLRLGGASFRLCFFKHASKLKAIVCRAPLRAVVCAEVPQKEKSVLLQSARLRLNCYRQEGQAFPKVTVKNVGVFYSF